MWGTVKELSSIQRGEREPKREGRKERWGVKATPFSEMPLKASNCASTQSAI